MSEILGKNVFEVYFTFRKGLMQTGYNQFVLGGYVTKKTVSPRITRHRTFLTPRNHINIKTHQTVNGRNRIEPSESRRLKQLATGKLYILHLSPTLRLICIFTFLLSFSFVFGPCAGYAFCG